MEKILIIDDSPVQASLLASILKDEYDITVANTAQAGLDCVRSEAYSLILSDVVMPDMDNTTTREYWNDRWPERRDIIEYFDTHIKIDWDKALRQPINREGSVLKLNGSGHLVVSSGEKERRREKGKKFIFKEEELEELFLKQDNE